MVIRGNSRGNARQLSHYLLAQKDNEAIRILDIDGQDNPTAEELHQSIYLMGISAELSRSEKGLYHAQINPAIGEDKGMDDDHWRQAGDILGRQLGLDQQRRAIVLHTKKGRTHAHVVWERYDHQQEKMVSDSFSRLAQDRARKEMETTFSHAATPHRNRHRPELKASLSSLWKQTGTGAQFVKAARNNGYIISEGSGRSPYMVVDANGRSYDLTRQLQGVKLKDVRQRLRHESLMGEKDAITYMRKKSKGEQEGGDSDGKQKTSLTQKITTMKEQGKQTTNKTAGNDNSKAQNTKNQFSQNKADTTDRGHKNEKVKGQFAENSKDATQSAAQSSKQQRRDAAKQRLQPKPSGPSTSRNTGMDVD